MPAVGSNSLQTSSFSAEENDNTLSFSLMRHHLPNIFPECYSMAQLQRHLKMSTHDATITSGVIAVANLKSWGNVCKELASLASELLAAIYRGVVIRDVEYERLRALCTEPLLQHG